MSCTFHCHEIFFVTQTSVERLNVPFLLRIPPIDRFTMDTLFSLVGNGGKIIRDRDLFSLRHKTSGPDGVPRSNGTKNRSEVKHWNPFNELGILGSGRH